MSFFEKNKHYIDNDNDRGIKVRLSPDNILRLVIYTTVYNPFVRQKNLHNLENFLNSVSISKSFHDTDVIALNYFKFLKAVVKIKNDGTANTFQVMEDIIYDNYSDTEIPTNYIDQCFNHILEFMENDMHLSEKETLAISEWIEDRLRLDFFTAHTDELKNVLDSVTMGSLDSGTQMNRVDNVIAKIHQGLNKVKTLSNLDDSSIDFTDTTSDNTIQRFIDTLRAPDNRLKCGFKALNRMINGGFQAGRLYVFAGTAKSFKSGTLINIVLTAMKHNKIPPERTNGRQPVILYYTMENDSIETLDRIFYYYYGVSIAESKASKEEVIKMIQEAYYNESGIGLVVKYAPSQSVNTDHLVDVLNDLKENGKECVMLVQDYLRRIRPARTSDEQRLAMGNIADEFSIIAKTMKIPVITATQLNREATNLQEKAKTANVYDSVQNLYASHIAESIQIQQNTDYLIVIGREDVHKQDSLGNNITESYLAFKLVASRDRQKEDDYGNKLEYFALPFDNGFRLTVDEGTDKEVYYRSVIDAVFTDEEKNKMKELQDRFNKESQNRRDMITNNLFAGGKPVMNNNVDPNAMIRNNAIESSTMDMNKIKVIKDLAYEHDPSSDIDNIFDE